jgi:hypothetical protein
MINLQKENVSLSPIQEGDAGIVLKKDGSFQIFTTGDVSGSLTTEQQVQSTRLMALVVALSTPSIMDSLIEASSEIKLDLGVKH